MRLHDPYLLIRHALKNELINKQGWKWSEHYLNTDKTLNNMVHSYKVSRYLKDIKFGVEVPKSTKHALKIDAIDGTYI